MSPAVALTVSVLLLAGNAFFVGAEFALIAARRSQIEPRANAGSRLARTTLAAMEQITMVMAGAQLGITVCSLGLGAVSEPAIAHGLEPWFERWGVPEGLVHPVALALALAIVVYLHVVLGEMVPKNIALATPERAALVLGPPMMAVVVLVRPLIAVLNALANAMLRLLRIEPRDEVSSAYTREEVAALVEESRGEGLLADAEYDRLSGALGFSEKTVHTVVMEPDSLATVRRGSTAAEIEDLCAHTGYSRFPVVSDDGELVGYLHITVLLEYDHYADRYRRVADKWIRPLARVSEDDLLSDALETLQRRGAHMARAVDAQGSVRGLVALEDVIEELVGEIRDAAHLEDV